jgi:class 3 adenylate cyclase/tetratricopeptide (TPR) repeat protein
MTAGLTGENRLVTMLFADMSGSVSSTRALDAEDAALLVNRLLQAMVAATTEYGGQVDRFLGDGVLAVFGAPSVREDDAERAIRAALRIGEQARKLGLGTTAGINTGEVYFGTVGSDLYREVTVMGPAVNLAARLQGQASAGDILVSEATWRLTRGAFEFEPMRVEIKGIDEPVAAYRVLGASAHPEKRRGQDGVGGALVGRDEQLRLLVEVLADAAVGHGRLVLITGEAGIGKTRLVAELRARSVAANPAPWWLEGHCREMTMSLSYAPLTDALHSLIGMTAGDIEATPNERVAAALGSLVERGRLDAKRAAELHPLLGWLLASDLDATPSSALPTDPEQLKREIFDAVRDLLVAAGGLQPLVVWLDDLHWADALSVELVKYLLTTAPDARLLIVCSFRLEPGRPCATLAADTELEHRGLVRHLRLEDLTRLEVERLLGILLGSAELPAALKAWIVSRTRGIPFYVEELVRGLIDRGVIRLKQGAWTAISTADETPVPESIQSLIRARLDLVSPETKAVLHDAAVLGMVFRTDVLVLLCGESPRVQAALQELEARTVIQRASAEGHWSFRHALIQETAYKSMLRSVRAGRHAKAGAALEELSGGRPDEPTEEIAHHYDLGEVPDKAASWLFKAGRRARRTYLNDQAVRDFRRGLAWLTRRPTDAAAESTRAQMALEFHEELGNTLDVMAHHSEARASYEAGLAAAPDTASVTRATLLRKIGITLGSEDRFDDAMRFYAEAKRVLDQETRRDPAWWVEWLEVQIEQMWIHYQADRWEDMAELAERLRPAVERHGTAVQRVGFYRCLGAMSFRRDRYVVSSEAIRYSRKALTAADASGDVMLVGHASFSLGFALMWNGDFAGAEQNLDRALAIWDRTGNIAGQAACQVYLTVLARLAGNIQLAHQRATKALKVATLANAVQYVGAAKANLAWVALRGGKEAEAEELGRAALGCWAPLANAYAFKWQAVWPLLWLALQRDDLTDATALADQLLAHSQQLPAPELRPLLESAVQGDGLDESRIRGLLRQAAGLAQAIGYL